MCCCVAVDGMLQFFSRDLLLALLNNEVLLVLVIGFSIVPSPPSTQPFSIPLVTLSLEVIFGRQPGLHWQPAAGGLMPTEMLAGEPLPSRVAIGV